MTCVALPRVALPGSIDPSSLTDSRCGLVAQLTATGVYRWDHLHRLMPMSRYPMVGIVAEQPIRQPSTLMRILTTGPWA